MIRLSKKNFYRNTKNELYRKLNEEFYNSDVNTEDIVVSGPFRDSSIQFEPVEEVETTTRKQADLNYITAIAGELKDTIDAIVDKFALVQDADEESELYNVQNFIFDQHYAVRSLIDSLQALNGTLDTIEIAIQNQDMADEDVSENISPELADPALISKAVVSAVNDWEDANAEPSADELMDASTKENGCVNAYDNMFIAPKRVKELVHADEDEDAIITDILRNR